MVIATGYDVYRGGVYELSPNEVSVKMQSTTAMVLEEIRGISNMDFLVIRFNYFICKLNLILFPTKVYTGNHINLYYFIIQNVRK